MRLRYNYLVNGGLVSKTGFQEAPVPKSLKSVQTLKHLTNGATYNIVINLKENEPPQWLILDGHSDLVALSGHAKTVAKAQKEIIKALSTLGIAVVKDKRAARRKNVQTQENPS